MNYANKLGPTAGVDSTPQGEAKAELMDLANELSRVEDKLALLVGLIQPVLARETGKEDPVSGRPFGMRTSPFGEELQERTQRAYRIAEALDQVIGRIRL